MRSMIARARRALQRVRLHKANLYVADLECMLSGLLTARDTLEGDISHTTVRLMQAKQRRDDIAADQITGQMPPADLSSTRTAA